MFVYRIRITLGEPNEYSSEYTLDAKSVWSFSNLYAIGIQFKDIWMQAAHVAKIV